MRKAHLNFELRWAKNRIKSKNQKRRTCVRECNLKKMEGSLTDYSKITKRNEWLDNLFLNFF
jgi:hypothetical protein